MKRFGRSDANSAIPHPAKYSALKQERVSNLVSSSFRAPVVPEEYRMPYMISNSEAPDPMHYNPRPSKAYKNYGPSATFKSVTGRNSARQNNLPCPGSYEVAAERSSIGAVASFKSSSRYGASTIETPGPASYGIEDRTADKPKQRRQFISIAQFTKPAERPLSTFSSQESTSARSTKPKKSNLSYIAEKIGPMPGRYNVAKASNNLKPSRITRSVFESKTQRFAEQQEGPTKHLGPGFYQPITEIKRSFHLNLGMNWA